jgi:hypothetical protein
MDPYEKPCLNYCIPHKILSDREAKLVRLKSQFVNILPVRQMRPTFQQTCSKPHVC